MVFGLHPMRAVRGAKGRHEPPRPHVPVLGNKRTYSMFKVEGTKRNMGALWLPTRRRQEECVNQETGAGAAAPYPTSGFRFPISARHSE